MWPEPVTPFLASKKHVLSLCLSRDTLRDSSAWKGSGEGGICASEIQAPPYMLYKIDLFVMTPPSPREIEALKHEVTFRHMRAVGIFASRRTILFTWSFPGISFFFSPFRFAIVPFWRSLRICKRQDETTEYVLFTTSLALCVFVPSSKVFL